MSLDVTLLTDLETLSCAPMDEARRQVGICNACRYCEGCCAVFPAITRPKTLADGDLTQLANLCDNCRGCHYACQYSEPHAFALNLPRALAEVRTESWNRFVWPGALGGLFQRSGVALAAALVAGIAALFLAVLALPGGGEGFYAYLGHSMMVMIFAPAFLLPLAAMAMSLRAFWREVGGARHPVGPARRDPVGAASGGVLAFFLLIPYSRMAHGFYRFAALVRDAQIARRA